MQSNKIISTSAMVVSSKGKTVKGILDVLATGYRFYTSQYTVYEKDFDIADVEIVKGTKKVNFAGIFSKEKECISFSISGNLSNEFMLDGMTIDKACEDFSMFKSKIIEERRIQEAERVRKEEEERKRKEEEERLRKEREEKEKNWASYLLNNQNRRAMAYFLDTPYRSLGLSAAANKNDANDAFDRFKKLARLKAESSYKTPYQISGFKNSDLNVSICQKAVSDMSDYSYKFFSFETEEACSHWGENEYRSNEDTNLNYDVFLANYLFACLTDPLFKEEELWKTVFDSIGLLINDKSASALKSRMGADFSDVSASAISTKFAESILGPVSVLADDTNIDSYFSLYRLLDGRRHTVYKELVSMIGSEISQWFERKQKPIEDELNSTNEKDTITGKKSDAIKAVVLSYLNETTPVLDIIESSLQKEKVRVEMIKSQHTEILRTAMIALDKASNKKNVIFVANKVYQLENDEDYKQRMRNRFGLDVLDGAEYDADDGEYDNMGDRYMKGDEYVKKDEKKAVKWYEKAARMGNSDSQTSLGRCYLSGEGVAKSDTLAVMWFRRAVEQGNSNAMVGLALQYIQGEGVERDYSQALDLLRKAEAKGHPMAGEIKNKTLQLMLAELEKAKKALEHEHYDIGFQVVGYGTTKIVEVTLNYSANVYLMDDDNFDNYQEHERFSYYGGRATQSPYRIKIPETDHWHLVIDNGEDGMGGIESKVSVRTLNI